MSLYPTNIKIDDVVCGVQMRGANGYYICIFEKEFASLDDLEGINWDNPAITGGDTVLPVGYGYEVVDISYKYSTQSYHVTIKVKTQYLGDVTAYVAQVDDLQSQVTEKNSQIQQLTAEKDTLTAQLAEKTSELENVNNQLSEVTNTLNTMQASADQVMTTEEPTK